MACFEQNIHIQISSEDSVLSTTFWGIMWWALLFWGIMLWALLFGGIMWWALLFGGTMWWALLFCWDHVVGTTFLFHHPSPSATHCTSFFYILAPCPCILRHNLFHLAPYSQPLLCIIALQLWHSSNVSAKLCHMTSPNIHFCKWYTHHQMIYTSKMIYTSANAIYTLQQMIYTSPNKIYTLQQMIYTSANNIHLSKWYTLQQMKE